MTESQAALSRIVEATLKALLILAIVAIITLCALITALAAAAALLLLLTAYTLAGLAYHIRHTTNPTAAPTPLPDSTLAGTPLAPHLPAFRSAGLTLAQAISLLTSIAALWLIIGWIGQPGHITYPRLIYGLSCLLPALLLLARRGQRTGAFLLGGLAALSLLAVLTYAPPILIPITFAIVNAVALLTAHHHLPTPIEAPTNGNQATLR